MKSTSVKKTDSAPEVEALSRAHASTLARYDALTFFRNALTVANAGFSKSLELALGGDDAAARSGLRAATALLAAATECWRAVDQGTAFDAKAVEALIAEIGTTDAAPT